MYLPIAKKTRRISRNRTAKLKAKFKAKNRRRRNGLKK
jgi:hypothetical protein